ncbi:stomatal closure-related actin-binding protein 1 isoform X2 [Arachis hypogaea]|uniref:Stomatal closure-related actin-binding protein 1 n=1 Tax=Arachis hypogaea TaxID=3818 RepID=A0A445A9F1_ARAHY|nr:stomatal closure-related actin-binding protein 1 isoform X2 [Arachis hypogaea]QHN98908.1 Stomatal closure-related actin-binding protein [Arachis hypogaea]RYR23070.1 hypothetical protein Ahy_B03g068343 isoform C [Arachis hypogaea]
MTRVTRDFGDTMQKEAVPAVSSDVVFTSSRFPNYRIGANNQIMETKEDPKVLSMKEVVARETAQLLEQQNRLSVRDLASKFERGLAAAAKLSEEDIEQLMKEVQEARRIKMLHQPSKVMDMEHELRALRAQLSEKTRHYLRLQKELARTKKGGESVPQFYELEGTETLGSYLEIQPCSDIVPEVSKCSIQWYRVSSDGTKKELISGATKSIYAPEPFDVGRILQVDIISDGQHITLSTTGPIDPAAGLGTYVEALVRKHDTEFNVVVTQINGSHHPTESIHVLHVGKMRIKLCKGKTTIAKEYYSSSMQLCGVRGGGNAVAQALFWQPKQGYSFVLAFESERERNAAIMLARRFAFDCNIMLAGPDDRAPLGT